MVAQVRRTKLYYLAMAASRSQSTRAYIACTGFTPVGHKVWTSGEDRIVRRLYPNMRALLRFLPYRTFWAIRNHAIRLGLSKKRTPWTTMERRRLKRLCVTHDRARLKDGFPDRSWEAVRSQIYNLGLSMPPILMGHPKIDRIRILMRRVRVTLRDLDYFANSRKYFKSRAWRRYMRHLYLDRALTALRDLAGLANSSHKIRLRRTAQH
jgi:hypothetical protein